jgi:hypothetical protein
MQYVFASFHVSLFGKVKQWFYSN